MENSERFRLHRAWIKSTYSFRLGRGYRLDWGRAGKGIVSVQREDGADIARLYFNPDGVENAAGLVEGLSVEIDGQVRALRKYDKFESIDFGESGAIWYFDEKGKRHLVVRMRIRSGLSRIRQAHLLSRLLKPEPMRKKPQPSRSALRWQRTLAKVATIVLIIAIALAAGYILSRVGSLVVGPLMDRFFEAILPGFW